MRPSLRWGHSGAMVAGAGRMVEAFLHGISPTDSTTFLAVGGGLLLVSLLACMAPARKAMKVQPMQALRYE